MPSPSAVSGLSAAVRAAACAESAEPLHLDLALQLLRHAGRELPPEVVHSPRGLQALIDALVEISSRDALTGLANRRSFELSLVREIDRVARSGEAALLLTLDIDHFKRINDTYGHAAGDEVIRAVAAMLTETVRPMDLVARVGGEEFAVILPNCSAVFAEKVADRIRSKVQAAIITTCNGDTLQTTISIGGAYAPQWVRSSPLMWTERADRQLYRAKTQGRNQVCLEPSATSAVSAEEKELLFSLSPFHDHE